MRFVTSPSTPSPCGDPLSPAERLSLLLEGNDAAAFAEALGELARRQGMREVAARTGLSRESLYKALRPGAKPRFDTLLRVCGALGVRLVVRPQTGNTLP